MKSLVMVTQQFHPGSPLTSVASVLFEMSPCFKGHEPPQRGVLSLSPHQKCVWNQSLETHRRPRDSQGVLTIRAQQINKQNKKIPQKCIDEKYNSVMQKHILKQKPSPFYFLPQTRGLQQVHLENSNHTQSKHLTQTLAWVGKDWPAKLTQTKWTNIGDCIYWPSCLIWTRVLQR